MPLPSSPSPIVHHQLGSCAQADMNNGETVGAASRLTARQVTSMHEATTFWSANRVSGFEDCSPDTFQMFIFLEMRWRGHLTISGGP